MVNAENAAKEAKGLVVFDVEGVFLPKRRYIPFEATRKLGSVKFLKIIFFGLLYEVGLLSLETALKRIFKYFRGYTIKDLRHYYENMPLLPDSVKVLENLHENGWKTALISSGLPHIFVKELANKLGADYAFGLELVTVDKIFTGEIKGDAIKKNGKAIILKKILSSESIPSKNCILVADDRNNLQLFKYSDLKIGYNPDFMIAAKSDHIVTGKLSNILPIILESKTKKSTSSLSVNAIFRSVIHISGFAIPFICTFLLNQNLVILLILLTTFIYTISELTRIIGINLPVVTSITKHAAVKLELYEFATAPIFYASGIILSLIIFPPHISYVSIAILTLGDGFASLFGKKYGKRHYKFNKVKSLEGSIFGFIFAFLGAALFSDILRALIAAMAGMSIECLPTPVNDNLLVPLIVGLLLIMIFV